MTRAAVLGIVLVHGVAMAASTRLQVTSRPLRGSARLTYASSDPLAGLDKGAGIDPSAVSVEVFVRQAGVTTRWEIPAGTYAGRSGWLANDAARAMFVNRDAPAGPTGTMRTLFAPGRRVKLTTKSLGDANPLDLAATPSTPVDVAYVITNGGETHAHCARFASCAYTPLDAGSGWKLRCDGGVADLAARGRRAATASASTARSATAASGARPTADSNSTRAARAPASASRPSSSACSTT